MNDCMNMPELDISYSHRMEWIGAEWALLQVLFVVFVVITVIAVIISGTYLA